VTVEITPPGEEGYEIQVAPMPPSQIEQNWYI